MGFNTWISRFSPKTGQLPKPGIYHFRQKSKDSKNRMHLRVETDGNALLMVNAARAYHLNPTAAALAYWALSEFDQEQIRKSLFKNFDLDQKQAERDILPFLDQLAVITDPDEACPICELDLALDLPFSHQPSAPYRMDLAITYRCNNECEHCYNARARSYPELDTQSWKQIIDRCWDLGIPHLVFTGGEPTLRKDLPELIAYAEEKGMITGINTNGRRLKDPALLQKLVDAGLDHVQITLESSDANIHDEMVNAKNAWTETIAGIKNVVASDLYMMTNTTMLSINQHTISDTLDLLGEIGVPTVGLNALIYSGKGINVGTGLKEEKLGDLLEIAKQKTSANNQKLIWYTPTEYCHFNPIQHDLGIKGCSAALYNMCIEPDGAILPCQSYYEPLGNMLLDDWDSIWNHELAVSLRDRHNLPEKCNHCDLVLECGGGCPLTRLAEKQLNPLGGEYV
jgi:radical SAM protein with 4Fe4S-binding SPASM domain